MVKKTLNKIFRPYCVAFRGFSRNIDMVSSKSGLWDQKKLTAAFRFYQFCWWSFYPTGINIGLERPQHVLKHAEKQSETRRAQSFGAKSGAGAAMRTPAYYFSQKTSPPSPSVRKSS